MEKYNDRVANVKIWKDTLDYFDKNPEPVTRSTLYKNFKQPKDRRFGQTQVKVYQGDMIDVALHLKLQGHHVALLNMADDKTPGGLVHRGCNTQEECCFRRSNYHLHLLKELYPIPDNKLIYSKSVKYIKRSEMEDCEYLDHPVYLDMIAVVAPRHPDITKNRKHYVKPEEKELMRKKIRLMFKVAHRYNTEVLILSALGCGAFHNPSFDVATLFKEELMEFNGCFGLVIFAMFGDNFPVFQQVLEGNGERPPKTKTKNRSKKRDKPKTKQ